MPACAAVFALVRSRPGPALLSLCGWMTLLNIVNPIMAADGPLLHRRPGLDRRGRLTYYYVPFELVTQRSGSFPGARVGAVFPAFATSFCRATAAGRNSIFDREH